MSALQVDSQELKRHLLEMMEWFHQFCVEHNLRYYVLGGTMLGAARHQGFIPWDDDIDVGMPRKDYMQLEKLLSGKIVDTFTLETPNTEASDYFYSFSKLYDTKTTLVENVRCRIRRGIYIDIFPLDGMGQSREEAEKNYAPIAQKLDFLLARVTGIRKGRSFLKNAAVIAARLLPDFIVSKKSMLHEIEKMCQSRDFDTCSWGGNPAGAWRFKEIMPKSIMGEPTLYKFEHLQVYGAENYDEYLTHLYGEWRKLPPVEKRVTHHDFVECSLDKPYMENNT